MNPGSRLRVKDGVVSREMRGVVIVLNPMTGRYFRLDGSAAAIWRLIDQHDRLESIVEAAVALGGGMAGDMERDIAGFVETAAQDGLIEIDGPSHTSEPGLSGERDPVLQITRSGLIVSEPLAGLKAAFERQQFLQLPQLIAPSLLESLQERIDAGAFVDRAHHGIGTELCLTPGLATSALQLLFNDPALLDAVSCIAGCEPLCFDGRVYRMMASAGHYDSWHSDAGEDRLVAVSVNFSREPYAGGMLEIRQASDTDARHVVANAGWGHAVMFRISPALRHRVTAVQGPHPRTAYAGWFRAAPDFQELFFSTLNPNAASSSAPPAPPSA